MKRKLTALALAAALATALAGCNMATPATVGTIGDVEIPAGLYLLTQYNNYSTAAGAAELATGETANDIAAVLKAPASGTIGDEEFSGTGAEYLAKLVANDLDRYAAVETAFAVLGGELTEADQSVIDENVDSMWEANSDLYEVNGIGKESVRSYVANSYKSEKLFELYYGPDGPEPVTEEELKSFITDDCLYIQSVELPLLDYSTYAFADEDQKAAINDIAIECVAELKEAAPAGTDNAVAAGALQTAAAEYVPQAFEALGGSLDASMAPLYTSSRLVLPDEIAYYDGEDGANTMRDAFAEEDAWTVADLGVSLLAGRKTDPLDGSTVEDLREQYNLLEAVRSDELEARLLADGAALPHALDQNAMNTYKPAKIKRSV